MKRLFSFIRPYLIYLILSILFSLIFIFAQLAAPILIGNAIDYIIDKQNVQFLSVYFYCLLLLITVIIAIIFQFLSNLFAVKLSQKTAYLIRKRAFEKIYSTPLLKMDKLNHGDMILRLTLDINRISDGLLIGFNQFLSAIITIFAALILMLRLNYIASFSVIAITPLSVITAFFIGKYGQKMFSGQIKNEGELSGLSEEFVLNQRLIKLYNYENKAKERFEESNLNIKKFGQKAVFISALVNPSTRIINGFAYVLVCLIGSLMIIKGNNFSVGGLSAFLSYAVLYSKPFTEITAVITDMQSAIVSLKRIYQILDLDQENQEESNQLTITNGEIEFINVSFKYDTDYIIKDFSVKIDSGAHVALIGKTGSGKTTLLSLLMRFYDYEGTIKIDGVDIKTISKSSLRQNIGMVLQDSFIFKGSIKENIAFSKQNATDEEIVEASKRARIHDFIMSTSNGYETIIEPVGLFEGIKQLISIARVFLLKPKLVILDEATSNIDALSELKIKDALSEITKGQTTLTVAHRLSTIKDSDLIIVLEKGQILDMGDWNKVSHLLS